jgi:hypothetical protein
MATDFYLLNERLTDDERAIRDRLRARNRSMRTTSARASTT